MAGALIPTLPDEPNYTMRTTLDGAAYQLTFRYSERETCFYVDLALDDGTLLAGGCKVVCDLSLFKQFAYDSRLPQGAVIAIPTSGASDEPPGILSDGTGELGDGRRVQLYYFTQAEVLAGA